jgi:type IV pilus assembly protein PilM
MAQGADQWSVGVDLGAAHIKLVCLHKEASSYRLMAHGVLHRNNLAQIREIFSTPAIKSGHVRVNVADSSLKIRRVELPHVPKTELPEIIKWGMKDVVGGEVDNYIFRYQELPEVQGKVERPYLIFAIMRDSLKSKVDFLKQLGVPQPAIVEPNVSALGFAIRHSYGVGAEDSCVVVDMGCTSSLFMVMGSEGLFFSRPLGNISGDSLTKQIGRAVGVDDVAAEQLKLAYPDGGITEDQLPKIKKAVSNFITSVAVEIQRSIDAYIAQCPGKPVTRIYFTGGGCQVPDFISRISGALNVATEILEPFQKVDLGRFRLDVLDPHKVYYATACGLALE